jgi:Flp pilus assembly protein TadD
LQNVNVEAQVRGIFGLFSQGRHAEALKLARQLHRAAPQLAIANYCVGHGLAASRQPKAALPFLRKAAQAEPRNAEFLVRFGKVLLDVGRIREAESVLLKAHDLNPKLPMVPWTLGMYYASIDRFDVAAGHFAKVLQSQLPPEAVETARLDWANALIENGQTEEAEKVLRAALPHPQVRGAALVKLSTIRPFALNAARMSRLLEDELARKDVSNQDRSSLLAAKSRGLRAAGDLEGEYATLQASKSATRGSNYDVSRFAAQVDAIIAAFTPAVLSKLVAAAGESSLSACLRRGPSAFGHDPDGADPVPS